MSRFFTVIAALLFLAGAAVHAYRLFCRAFAISVDGHSIPQCASWPEMAFALLLGVMLLAEARRSAIRQ